jgi:hypothetical protein
MRQSEVTRVPVPEHLQAEAYRYRRFRRWVAMLTQRFGYTESSLAGKLRTTEDVIRGTDEPQNVLELSRLWRATGRLIELPPVGGQAANDPTVVASKAPIPKAQPTGGEYQGHEVVAATGRGTSRMDGPGEPLSRRHRRHLRPF